MGVTWNIKGKLSGPEFPQIMGIINATPDSFHPDSRVKGIEYVLRKTEKMIQEGADIIDIGGASSRPGAETVAMNEELDRVIPVVEAIARNFPDTLLSIDTWRAQVAKEAITAGAGMVNDISAGQLDNAMFHTVAELAVPIILMHMQGTPVSMQQNPEYEHVVQDITSYLSARKKAAFDAGIADVILDPGFGFGKTLEQNFSLLRGLESIVNLGAPVLVGLSRKSMITKALGVPTAEALNGTSVLNTIALDRGAHILRVHDVSEAKECVRLLERLNS
jgi:dihydropteroate synthase